MPVASADRHERIRVGALGFGRVGRATVELALTRPWIEIVSVIARRDERHGEPVCRTVQTAPDQLFVRTDAAAALTQSRPDVVIIATRSHLTDVLAQLELAVDAGARTVLCTAEELAYVRPEDSPAAMAIHELAERSAATIVATGVNPGFVLDLWPLVLSGLAWDVARLEARRVVDVSVFAPHTRAKLGIGHDRATFAAGVEAGSILGHLGFRESLRLLCDGMGRPADHIAIHTDPVIAEQDYVMADDRIEVGTTVGVSQQAVAWHDDDDWISVQLLLHAAPGQDGVRTVDEMHLSGRHELRATLDPGAGAILSTAAQLINSIPVALRAGPGLYAPGQLPPSVPWLATIPPPLAPLAAAPVA